MLHDRGRQSTKTCAECYTYSLVGYGGSILVWLISTLTPLWGAKRRDIESKGPFFAGTGQLRAARDRARHPTRSNKCSILLFLFSLVRFFLPLNLGIPHFLISLDSFLLFLSLSFLLLLTSFFLSFQLFSFVCVSRSSSLPLLFVSFTVSLKLSSITRCVFRNSLLFHLDSFRHLLKLISLSLSLSLSLCLSLSLSLSLSGWDLFSVWLDFLISWLSFEYLSYTHTVFQQGKYQMV